MNPFLGADPATRSLNRARIEALSGIEVDEGILGKSGYDLLAAESLRRDIVAEAAALAVDPAAPDLIRRFDRAFATAEVSPLAISIARRYGRRLGFLLLMLRRGDDANRAARPEWSDAHWTFWREVRRVFLGGGLVAGNMGASIVEAARELLHQHGVTDLALERSPHGVHLPLVGLARAAPADTPEMLVLDFGQTSVKRGLALYQESVLVELRLLSPAPTVCGDLLQPTSPAEARRRWQRMLEIIHESWNDAPYPRHTSTGIGISLACYLFDGHPSPRDRGCFGALQFICDHLESFVREQIAARLGAALHLVLMHDGAAAAAAYAGAPDAVVLTLGTAIGNGFPPPSQGYRPVLPQLAIRA
ncbi:MAG TPA: hypothetical protein VER55_10270 [Ardenticatenaceae bacterium]|nr:hypothetical protein [Ardenticatenaceae bacterium]